MSGKSGFPQREADAVGLPKELQKYLDRAGRLVDAVADIDPAATDATQNAKINELLAALREAGKMVP